MKNKSHQRADSAGVIRTLLKKSPIRIGIEVVVLLLITVAIIRLLKPEKSADTEDLKEGIAYIQALEQQDISPVEKIIKENKKQERKEAMLSGDFDVWKQFNDAVIMGDSRAVGFSYHGFVEAGRVFAEGGATIRDIPNYLDSIRNVNPSSIFLCYGLNDISIGLWETIEEYLAELDTVLEQLHETVPEAVVYVNSIIPATDPAFEQSSKWREIPDWNVLIKQHCEEYSIPYTDITQTVEDHKDLYDEDGIHMQTDFYEFWAIDMITEVNENE